MRLPVKPQKDDSDDDSSSDFAGVDQGYLDDSANDDVTSEIQVDKSLLADKAALVDKSVLADESVLADRLVLADESVLADKSVLADEESALVDKSAGVVAAQMEAVQQALKKGDAFSLIKPRLDRLAGLAGKDPEMVIEIQDTLAELEISLLC
jgi:hypothetical protein